MLKLLIIYATLLYFESFLINAIPIIEYLRQPARNPTNNNINSNNNNNHNNDNDYKLLATNDDNKYFDGKTAANQKNYYNYDLFLMPQQQQQQQQTTNIALEQSILPAELIELTTPSSFPGTTTSIIASSSASRTTAADFEPTKSSAKNVTTSIEIDLNIRNTLNNSDFDRLLMKFDGDNGNTCLLDNIKAALMWWSNSNGTLNCDNLNLSPLIEYLDLSYRNITTDEDLYLTSRSIGDNLQHIVAFSAAYNNLTTAPHQTLSAMATKLKYLTLSGNQFAAFLPEIQKEGDGIAWATFPELPALIELDLSNCCIEYLTRDVFRNMSNLQKLYISHNKMLTIPFDTFELVSGLEYLDLSFTNVLAYDYQVSLPTLEAVINLIYGVKVQQTTFKYLPNLLYLDLSHTKLTRNSAVAFTHLSDKLKYLSLCYTAFPMIGNAIFKNTALVGLDLSGNSYAASNIIDDGFEGVANTLKYLYFERSNLKDLTWSKSLNNLRVLGLAANNINSISLDMFTPLNSLQILDLSSNHIGNWYTRVFTRNENLKVLNLRDNNINIITSEMLKDFSLLDYLSLGDNNFVCDCILRELVDLAAENNKNAECSKSEVLKKVQNVVNNNPNMEWMDYYVSPNISKLVRRTKNVLKSYGKDISIGGTDKENDLDVEEAIWRQYLLKMKRLPINASNKNSANQRKRLKMKFIPKKTDIQDRAVSILNQNCSENRNQTISTPYDKINSSLLKFQLLDYEEEHYWCFNETERLNFMELNCAKSMFVEDIAQKLDTLTTYVITFVCTLLGLSLLGVLIYIKRWHIYYYYSSLKTAALLSVAAKENTDRFNAMKEHDPNTIYDIFISYCESDRDWVLEELMPNVEESGDISICLHERDFQIGVSILDNIISCMERSRSLMLIISSSFLLSKWCQFEMYLAQHRILDFSKVHLILVFLEEIPRSKRPKILQYLMDVKTYIKWPGAKVRNKKGGPKKYGVLKNEERKIFWKRMRRSLEHIGLAGGNGGNSL